MRAGGRGLGGGRVHLLLRRCGPVARGGKMRLPCDAAPLTDVHPVRAPCQAEPVNRLATLRFLEGDFEDSARLCLRVLHDKPWHFGASSGIVMVYAQMGNADDAKRWALHARTNKHTHTHTHTHSLTHIHT